MQQIKCVPQLRIISGGLDDKAGKKTLGINFVIALVVIGVQFYFTDLFGYGISPILVDFVAFLLVLILTAVTYVGTGRDKKVLLLFLPLFVVSLMPILVFFATFVAWNIGGFSP